MLSEAAVTLGPSPQHSGVPWLPQLIEKPSTTVAPTSRVAITFCDVVVTPSFPGVPTRLVASANCTTWGHQSSVEEALKVPSIFFAILVFKGRNACSKIRGSNRQLFNKCNRYNCDSLHPNVSLQVCRHPHVNQVLKGDRKLLDNIFSLLGAN